MSPPRRPEPAFGREQTFKTKPLLTAQLRGAPRSARLSTIAKQGLALVVRCNQACSVSGSITVSAAIAKQLRLTPRHHAVAGGAVFLTRAGRAALHLRLTRAGKLVRRGQRTFLATLRVLIKPVGPGRSITLKQAVTLRP